MNQKPAGEEPLRYAIHIRQFRPVRPEPQPFSYVGYWLGLLVNLVGFIIEEVCFGWRRYYGVRYMAPRATS